MTNGRWIAFWVFVFALSGGIAAQGESVLPPGAWTILQKAPEQVTVKNVRAEGQPGGNSEALQVMVKAAAEPFYALGLGKNIPTAMAANTRIRLRFWARSETKNPIRAVLERNGPPFDNIAESAPILTPHWAFYEAVGTTKTPFAPDKVAVRLQVGQQAGVIEFAGVVVDTLGPDFALIAAREAVKPEAIKARIERVRKGDLTISVRDARGKPRSDVTITVKQTKQAFLFGCNIFGLEPKNEETAQKEYQERFVHLFNFATLPFYWGAFEAEKGKPDNEKLMGMADWCVAHNLTAKGHPLIWHEVYPTWAPKTADEVIPLLEDRIFDLIPRYRGKVTFWDVINETTVSRGTDTGIGDWAGRNGPVAVVQKSLSWARAADRKESVKAILLYNDFNLGPDLKYLLMTLRERNALPDAIGIQSHMHGGVWPLEKVWQTAEEYAVFKRPIHFTEVTVVSGPRPATAEKDASGNLNNWPSTAEGEKIQAEYLPQFYSVLFSNPNVQAITYGDFSDRGAWQGAPAGLLHADMTPKPVYERLKRLIQTEWRTNATGKPNVQGQYKTRAFYGDYEITVTDKAGQKATKTVKLPVGESVEVSLTL